MQPPGRILLRRGEITQLTIILEGGLLYRCWEDSWDSERKTGEGKSNSAMDNDIKSVEDIMVNPHLLEGKTLAQVQEPLRAEPKWRVETLGKGAHKGQGWVLREYTEEGKPTGRMIRWHPGGGRHGPGPYWRVNGNQKKSGIIPAGPET